MTDCHKNKLFRIDLGLSKYKPVWELQKKLVELRSNSTIPDSLIVTEHEPVITLGRGTDKNNLLESSENLHEKGIELYEIERGGDVTFHGPGQAVLYPIVDLQNRNHDVRQFLRDMEIFVVRALGNIGLKAGIKEGLTGIWVDDHKIGAIGVAVSKWITYHGVAINVNTDLDYFKSINPCGITEFPVGSISGLLGKEIGLDNINDLLAENFADVFDYEIEIIDDVDGLLK